MMNYFLTTVHPPQRPTALPNRFSPFSFLDSTGPRPGVFLICLLWLVMVLPISASEAQSSGTWTSTGNMGTARYGFSAIQLKNGKVLVCGGNGPSGTLATAELYDPITGTWSPTGTMKIGRAYYTAAGGYSYTRPFYFELVSSELLDATTGSWTFTGDMTVARDEHAMVKLANGRVLVAGGLSNSTILSDADLYTP